MRRSPAFITLVASLAVLPSWASGPERLHYGHTTFLRTWAGENSNEYQPEGDGSRADWRRMILFAPRPEVHDEASLRAAMGALAASYAARGSVIAQTCRPAARRRPAECSTVVRDAVQDTRFGLFAVTAVYRYVFDGRRGVVVMNGWRRYGMDAIDRDRAFVESAAGRDAIREALAWPIPLEAVPRPQTAREKAAWRKAYLRAIGE